MGWKKWIFYFENANLKVILNHLGRWYDIEVIFEKGNYDRKFEGEIEKKLNFKQVLKILEENKVNF
ncbi:DUF4974 domain-containing protein [Flavobacterium sp. 245]|uniref:DUF4974 domain-containing protein n=1 Tax=Flavobacterium sp. 245 TaxID=2512115 RepID=UPI0039776900